MQVHFSKNLKLNESKKEIICNLVRQRIELLIGVQNASYIRNVFFCDEIPRNVLFPSNPASHHIGLSMGCEKVDLYCTSQMFYSLIHQIVDPPSFDDVMMSVSIELFTALYL